MRCSLRSSKICLRPRSRRQSPHKNFAGVGCVGKNFGTQRRVGSHCGRVGKLEAPCRLKKKNNPHLKESVIKSAPTSVGEPNARAHSLTQSRPSHQNCYGHRKKYHYSIIMVRNKIAQKPVHGTTIVPHVGQQSSMMNEKHVQKTTRT